MRPELREKIIAFNKQRAAEREKAADLEMIMTAFAGLTDAVKALLPDDVKVVLEKHTKHNGGDE